MTSLQMDDTSHPLIDPEKLPGAFSGKSLSYNVKNFIKKKKHILKNKQTYENK